MKTMLLCFGAHLLFTLEHRISHLVESVFSHNDGCGWSSQGLSDLPRTVFFEPYRNVCGGGVKG